MTVNSESLMIGRQVPSIEMKDNLQKYLEEFVVGQFSHFECHVSWWRGKIL